MSYVRHWGDKFDKRFDKFLLKVKEFVMKRIHRNKKNEEKKSPQHKCDHDEYGKDEIGIRLDYHPLRVVQLQNTR